MKYALILAAALLAACGNNALPTQKPAIKADDAGARQTRSAPPGSVLANPDFEQTATDGSIPGWNQIQHAGPPAYAMSIDADGAYAGHGSFHMVRTKPEEYGTLQQALDVKPFAGKTIELSAMLKSRAVGRQGWKLFINADMKGAFKYSSGLTGDTDWKRDAVSLAIPAQATRLTVGVTLLDAGEGWMDNVELKTVD
ncbi:MAG: hypothetical protein JSR27_11160 [Proteobacteria bacterium]|nr:hypothetical protein [Pseudomonadota bacterium]